MSLEFYDLYCEEVDKNEKLQKKYTQTKSLYDSLDRQFHYLQDHLDDMVTKSSKKAIAEKEAIIKNKDEEIQSLKNEIAHLKSLLNNDSTNSGLPTSKTPIDKNKRIPNSRTKSGKKKGGQFGHPKHKLDKFDDDEITEMVEHKQHTCPKCLGEMEPTGKVVYKDEFELEIVVKKIRHAFQETMCKKCGCTVMQPIPNRLKEENQYGLNVQAIALELMNVGWVSMNRTKEIITGLSRNEICLSEGYIAKLQKRLAKTLEPFMIELKRAVIRLKIVHWDDTVIMISTNRACLRFYGDEQLALFTAHSQKDRKGLDEDFILNSLDKETIVVHDHNTINYNDDYDFQNAECCAHLLRDLKKIVDNLGHEWAKKMIDLLVKENLHRNQKDPAFDPAAISQQYDELLTDGLEENKKDEQAYYSDTEGTVLRRLAQYKENYLMWTLNEEVPFTNNESERALRGSKTKMKVSGQFNNLNQAQYFAAIRSYIETGKRFGLNTQKLIKRALEGEYVTLEEMQRHKEQNS